MTGPVDLPVGTTPSETPPERPRSPPFSLARMLVEAGMAPAELVAKAQDAAQRESLPLARVLVRDGTVLSRDLAAITALHLGLTMVELRNHTIDPQALARLPEEVARKYMVVPIAKSNGRLTLAMTDPTDLQLLQDLAVLTECAIEPAIATPEDIQEHLDISYRWAKKLAEGAAEEAGAPGGHFGARLLGHTQPTEVIDLLLRQALQDRASDVHIEATESRLRIRFRIDGILHDVAGLPLEMHPMIISRLKIMSSMNIAERRRPQDGHFAVEVQNRKVDVRVAVSNTVNGEMAVLRLLDKQFTLLGLDQLGLSTDCLGKYRRLMRLPYGMIVVCGPTGSGKSTTLYASVLQVDRMEHNVISLEDPVEYHITDVNQMQVHAAAGVTFATQLRSVLRLDPNVILVGEIRDQETADIATQAALTGHLVLTSLHANDSVSALLRLRDLGVAPYLLTSSVAGIVAQRMVRVVCRGCQTRVKRPLAEQEAFAAELDERREQFVYGAGCNLCAQTGYHGRTGVFEVLTMSDALRQLFLEDAPRHKLWEQALAEGMVPLRRDGMLKVKLGITTPYEVMRVLFSLDY